MHENPRILVALDFDNEAECLSFVDKLNPSLCRLKIGKELFTSYGPPIVEKVQARGFDVFLDLKFHDIPNTVAKAVAAAASLGVWMVNVHASGGPRMLDAARESLANVSSAPLLIAVTVLTSMASDELAVIGVEGDANSQVQRLAKLSYQHGLDGVVCSGHEVRQIKTLCSDQFLSVTPGIRPLSSDVGDQRRIMTPEQALSEGADYLVIGRPITKAPEPGEALLKIVNEINTWSEKS